MSHRSKIIRQSFGYKLRGWMLGLANMEIDRTVGRVRRNFLEELVELLEWIGLQPVKIRVQFLGGRVGGSGRFMRFGLRQG